MLPEDALTNSNTIRDGIYERGAGDVEEAVGLTRQLQFSIFASPGCISGPVVRPSAFDRESEPADSLSKAQRPQSARLAFEDRCVAVAVGEFDLDRAVVVEFGRAVAGNLVRFVRSFPGEPDRIVAVFDVETRMERAEGYFAPTVVADRHRRRPAEVEIGAIPNVGLEDPPAAHELAVSRRHPRASRLDRPYLRSASRTFCDARPLTGMPFFP